VRRNKRFARGKTLAEGEFTPPEHFKNLGSPSGPPDGAADKPEPPAPAGGDMGMGGMY